ncbi:esterase/lipase family protein [Kitasatospora sp. NPDC091335]|uniref:esterase/lipase family protein n=1 Tax=Kitasatospora sp. NPDC091335 TaxID=3364085 RepID=UPI00381D4284
MKPKSPLPRLAVVMFMMIAVSLGLAPAASASGSEPRKLAHRPIVFVHGWHGDSRTWSAMEQRAMDRTDFGYGAGELWPFDYSSVSKPGNDSTPIATLAGMLRQFIQDEGLVDKSPDGKIDIVAHSMGGLVARTYLVNGGASTTAHLVTLATPNHGTVLGNLCPGLCGTQAAEMGAKSDFLKWLNGKPETYGSTQYATFRSNVGDEPLEAALSPYPYACDKVVYGVDDDGERSAKYTGRTSVLSGAANLVSPCVGHDQIQGDDWTVDMALRLISDPNGAHTPKAAQVQCGDLTEHWGKGSGVRPGGWVSAHAQSCVVATGAPHSRTKSVYTELQIRGCGYYGRVGTPWYYTGSFDVNCDVKAKGILWRNGVWAAHSPHLVANVYERWLQVRTDTASADTGSKVAGEWSFDADAWWGHEWEVHHAKSRTPSMIIA